MLKLSFATCLDTIDLKNETGYDLIKKMSSNVVLLGDSIFDNSSYVKEGEADVLGPSSQGAATLWT
jgi:hypothetical protein